MIQGKIKKTWKPSQFKKLKYHIGNSGKPFQRIGASKKIMESYQDRAGAYICNQIPDVFSKLVKDFRLSKPVIALQKMKVGQVLPWHVDLCKTYILRNKIKDKKKIVRIIVFLEDSKPGHQLWIKDRLCTGEAGSFFGWMFGTKHMAANLGEQDRYTLQITGIKND
jgi:hypothetical protein